MFENKWDLSRFKFGICDVKQNYDFYFKWLLGKLHTIFIWEGLPDTIDETFLNNQLFLFGNICWFEKSGKLYALNGAVGGEPNEYYYPKQYIIANPVLGSITKNIDKDCVMMYNSNVDKNVFFAGGLGQLIKQTATLLADNIVSINTMQINTRCSAICTADDNATAQSAEMVLKKLYSGEPYHIVTTDIIDNFKVNPMATTTGGNNISELVQLHQYIISQFFQNIGIKSNAVMKKERLITDEVDSQDSILAVSIETMLNARQKAVEKINEMFGTSISVKLNPILTQQTEDTEEPQEETEDEEKEVENDG